MNLYVKIEKLLRIRFLVNDMSTMLNNKKYNIQYATIMAAFTKTLKDNLSEEDFNTYNSVNFF